jgi:hypothetical protein
MRGTARFIMVVLVVAALGLGAAVAMTVEGQYQVTGTNPDGTEYQGTAVIQRNGDRYTCNWTVNGEPMYGEGTLQGDRLSLKWGKDPSHLDDVVTYTIGSDGILRGVWSGGQGKETLTPQ